MLSLKFRGLSQPSTHTMKPGRSPGMASTTAEPCGIEANHAKPAPCAPTRTSEANARANWPDSDNASMCCARAATPGRRRNSRMNGPRFEIQRACSSLRWMTTTCTGSPVRLGAAKGSAACSARGMPAANSARKSATSCNVTCGEWRSYLKDGKPAPRKSAGSTRESTGSACETLRSSPRCGALLRNLSPPNGAHQLDQKPRPIGHRPNPSPLPSSWPAQEPTNAERATSSARASPPGTKTKSSQTQRERPRGGAQSSQVRAKRSAARSCQILYKG
mmetsp:Transcript_12796/g.41367  ORF Transcript_12796/g.41367 Transcript_12796/m.41367 type:complete len:276 (-) Transcript_12796:1102-1929(-)